MAWALAGAPASSPPRWLPWPPPRAPARSSPRPRCRRSPTTSSSSPTATSSPIEGYQDHIGETAPSRSPAAARSSAPRRRGRGGRRGVRDQPPGGVCWGAGTGLKVTPDIRPGDVVVDQFGAETVGDTTVQDVYVTGDGPDRPTTLTVKRPHRRGRRTAPRSSSASSTPTSRHRRRPPRHPRGSRRAAPRAARAATLRPRVDRRRTFTATYVSTPRRPPASRPAAAASASWPGRRRTSTATARA